LSPTKELSNQIYLILKQISKNLEFNSILISGGNKSIAKQMEALSNNVNCIVSTPGRFLEILKKNKEIEFKIKHFIIDECDKMMG
jgi:superfamily II DNA/RNA helicase